MPVSCPDLVEDSSATFVLFVYGTLMRGGCRFPILANQRFLGKARTQPCYALLNLGDYPGMVSHATGQVVHGELYEVERSLLPRLDEMEGAPDWFRLEPVLLQEHANAHAYFYRQSTTGRSRCLEGRWHNRRKRKFT